MCYFSKAGIGALCIAALTWFIVISNLQYQQAAADVMAAYSVLIDAGHGGEDGGTSTSDGVPESYINLQFAKKLEQILALCGFNTYMMRNDDNAVSAEGDTIRERKISDLKRRVEIANQAEGAVLVSLHQNFFENEKYHGSQVFYANTPSSRELADRLTTILHEAVDPSNRRNSKVADSVYLMNNIRCTGILVECGFISNYQEAQLLQSDDYQKKMSVAIASALALHLEEGSRENEV